MSHNVMHPSILKNLVIFSILCAFSHCATESELENKALNRYVKDGVYRNILAGIEMKWPDASIWKYKNYPEFDMSFDHVDGNSQFFMIGVRELVRKTFPDGFVEWMLERLGAEDINYISRNHTTQNGVEKFQITLDCKFLIFPREQYGVSRRVSIFAMQHQKRWIGIVYISPDTTFQDYIPEMEKIVNSITFIHN